jgi:hypothetical protein
MCGFVRTEQCAPALAQSATARERMPDMYAISSDNGRRASQTGPERPELPILFHLMDVSRPRAAAKDALASPAPAEQPKVAELSSLVTTAALDAVSTTLAAPATEFKATPAPELTAASLGTVSAESLDSPFKSIADSDKPASENAPDAKPATELAVTAALESAAQASQPAATVTLKSKTVERRQRKTPASEDWFASHGKFIAIGFVIALIGTVYYARTNRQQASPSKSEAVPQSPLVEIRSTDPPAESATKSVTTVAAVSDSKVELQPPSAPPLIASAPASDKTTSADKLFDFPATAKVEQRIAARSSTAAGSEAKNEQPPASSAPANSVPALAPAYPVTTSPPGYPSTTVTPAAYPQTSAPAQQVPSNPASSYRSQFPAQQPQQPVAQQPPPQVAPQQPAASGWSPPAGAYAPSQYQPMNNTASGPRYEQTGSGHF